MREDQADQIIDLLGEVANEIRGMRSDFMNFTGYNVYNMDDLAKRITGDTGYSIQDMMGPLGYNIQDLHERLVSIEASLSMIDINTSS